jgi:8-oxo-dGTP pyrophosphatase MutT (NUDIX family)
MAQKQTNLIASRRLVPSYKAERATQVAAVCYRQIHSYIEFLLVRTNRGRWTFPKGSIDPQLGARKSAEREAWEEAGAVGRVAEKTLHVYLGSKKQFCRVPQEFLVAAYLLEVSSMETPQEPFREPTWCSPEDACKMLAEGRDAKYGEEFRGVIDRALEAIQRKSRSVAARLRRVAGAGPLRDFA